MKRNGGTSSLKQHTYPDKKLIILFSILFLLVFGASVTAYKMYQFSYSYEVIELGEFENKCSFFQNDSIGYECCKNCLINDNGLYFFYRVNESSLRCGCVK